MIKLSDLLNALVCLNVKIYLHVDKDTRKLLYEGDANFAKLHIEDVDKYNVLLVFSLKDLEIIVTK
jgi:hypothetical protein